MGSSIKDVIKLHNGTFWIFVFWKFPSFAYYSEHREISDAGDFLINRQHVGKRLRQKELMRAL